MLTHREEYAAAVLAERDAKVNGSLSSWATQDSYTAEQMFTHAKEYAAARCAELEATVTRLESLCEDYLDLCEGCKRLAEFSDMEEKCEEIKAALDAARTESKP